MQTTESAVPTEDYLPTAAEGWPVFEQDEIDAVVDVLRSGKVNQWTGDRVRAFEAAYEQYVGAGHAIALANGSVSLELALRAFGIGPGDEVVVTPRTFVASAFCVMLVGATPVFADVDRDSGNITPQTVRAVLTERTKAIIPVHLAGWPVDMPGFLELAEEHDLFVIEDCAQAHGAEIGGRPVGAWGHAASFSFCQDKIMSTGGEGGLVLFRDRAHYDWAWSYKDHGKNAAKAFDRDAPPGFRWLHDSVGTNWRMLESSAAIGLRQLAKLDAWRAARTRNAAIWADALRDVPGVRIPAPTDDVVHAQYKFYVYVDGDAADGRPLRDHVIDALAATGVPGLSGSCSEVYLEEAFTDMDVPTQPVAAELGRTSLMFLVHPTLDPDRLRRRAGVVADAIRSVTAAHG